MRNNQLDAAETNIKKVIELNPKEMKAHLLLGTFYQSQSRFTEAEQQFHHAMDMDPKSPDPRAALARLYLAEGKGSDAEEILKQAKHDFPDNSTGYRAAGRLLFHDRRRE